MSAATGGWLLFYLVATLAYSLRLKRLILIDVVTLALLYTTRVFAGAAAVAVPVSPWLSAFLPVHLPHPGHRQAPGRAARAARAPGRGG